MRPFDLMSLGSEFRIVKAEEYALETGEERLWHLAIPGIWGNVTPHDESLLMACFYKHPDAIGPALHLPAHASLKGSLRKGKRVKVALQIRGATLISESDEDVLVSFPPEVLSEMAGLLGLKRRRKASPAQARILQRAREAKLGRLSLSVGIGSKEVASA